MSNHQKRRRTYPSGHNPHENMSFAEAFGSEEWKEFEAAVRPFAEPVRVVSNQLYHGEDTAEPVDFAPDGYMDEALIMARFREYLVIRECDPESVQAPAPALVLWDFLNSIGRQEPAFWRKLPMYSICRVRDGEIPISPKLSKHISDVFGTSKAFWSDMQQEYDRWESRWNDGSKIGEEDPDDI